MLIHSVQSCSWPTPLVLAMRMQEKIMHWYFYAGLVFFGVAATFTVWAMFQWEIACAASIVLV